MRKRIVILSMMILGILAPTALALSVPTFSDVNSSTDYNQAINWAVEQEIATGYGNGMWGPNECVKRAELVKMVMIAGSLGAMVNNEQYNAPQTFSDVKKGDWYFSYVYAAKDAGWISGYKDGTFKPNLCVNRAEAMKIATNALFSNPALDSSGGPIMYDDKIINDISMWDWYGPYARFLFKDRLVGTNHTVHVGDLSGAWVINFLPAGDMTRKEVAEMLYRIKHSTAYTSQF